MTPRRLSFSRYGVFDLDHLLTLAGDPSIGLLVSERTKHLLNNLAIEDIQDPRRYAVAYTPEGYEPLTQGDSEWSLFVSVVEGAQRELVDPMLGLDTYLTQLDKRAAPVKGKTGYASGVATGDDPKIVTIGPVPDGQIWMVTQITSQHGVGTWTAAYHSVHRGDEPDLHTLDGPYATLPQYPFWHSAGMWFLSPGDDVRSYWYGASANLRCSLRIAYAQLVEPL